MPDRLGSSRINNVQTLAFWSGLCGTVAETCSAHSDGDADEGEGEGESDSERTESDKSFPSRMIRTLTIR